MKRFFRTKRASKPNNNQYIEDKITTFTEMETDQAPNKEKITDWEHLHLSVDLVEASVRQLNFLCQVNRHPELYSGPVALNAIRRYETVWLPLAAQCHGNRLIAPLDIHWVWHCHMLAPYFYEKDCLKLAGKIIDHSLLAPDEHEYKKALKHTESLWSQHANGEPFNVLSTDCPPRCMEYTSKCSYQLQDAIDRQRMFYYQVSLPHYRDSVFLKKALSRYKKYLALKRRNPDEFLVPCYDFDLIWHSHQLHPLLYRNDTGAILGRMLNHDDSVNDRSENSKLNSSDANTRDLWRKAYNEEFAACGCMFRGDPPDGKLGTMSKAQIYGAVSKKSSIAIHSVKLQPDHINDEQRQKLSLKVCLTHRDMTSSETLLKFKGAEWEPKSQCEFVCNSAFHQFLQFDLMDKKGFLCLGSNQSCGIHNFPLAERVDAVNPAGQKIELAIPLHEGGNGPSIGLSVGFSLTIGQPTIGPCMLSLQSGPFQSCTIPENAEKLWGPIPLPKRPVDNTNTCNVASHRLFNHAQQLMFTIRVIHSIPLMMSAVQVYHLDQMISVAHLIGTDQLPTDDMIVGMKCPTLDYSDGERALIIKDHAGDWAIAVGRWVGFRKGVPGRPGIPGTADSDPIPGVPGVPGSPGHLSVFVYNLRKSSYTKMDILDKPSSGYAFEVDDILVDMKHANMTLLPECDTIGQNICLAVSVAVLQVLCQPRQIKSSSGTSSPILSNGGMASSRNFSGREVRRMECESLALVLAAGYLSDTPCNSYINGYSGMNKSCILHAHPRETESKRELG
ncbi:hypothetical protein CAPTEDRAFT_202493 [Capitella teleta]|uniref:Uncharacterized protein n=1 Tax=Capitella teleta TaxID=283909 RepID=R7T5P1_CAPTE|nr:hypothetical protein CAPTEDRAFT_202493 [Capitella teleta]|eukprot:ELT88483.1 hypothetical protein CAPTEDRAFT_202493 [Capitella teleta]